MPLPNKQGFHELIEAIKARSEGEITPKQRLVILAFLRSLKVFCQSQDRVTRETRLNDCLRDVEYAVIPKDSFVFHEYEVSDEIYVILSGSASVLTRKLASDLSAEEAKMDEIKKYEKFTCADATQVSLVSSIIGDLNEKLDAEQSFIFSERIRSMISVAAEQPSSFNKNQCYYFHPEYPKISLFKKAWAVELGEVIGDEDYQTGLRKNSVVTNSDCQVMRMKMSSYRAIFAKELEQKKVLSRFLSLMGLHETSRADLDMLSFYTSQVDILKKNQIVLRQNEKSSKALYLIVKGAFELKARIDKTPIGIARGSVDSQNFSEQQQGDPSSLLLMRKTKSDTQTQNDIRLFHLGKGEIFGHEELGKESNSFSIVSLEPQGLLYKIKFNAFKELIDWKIFGQIKAHGENRMKRIHVRISEYGSFDVMQAAVSLNTGNSAHITVQGGSHPTTSTAASAIASFLESPRAPPSNRSSIITSDNNNIQTGYVSAAATAVTCSSTSQMSNRPSNSPTPISLRQGENRPSTTAAVITSMNTAAATIISVQPVQMSSTTMTSIANSNWNQNERSSSNSNSKFHRANTSSESKKLKSLMIIRQRSVEEVSTSETNNSNDTNSPQIFKFKTGLQQDHLTSNPQTFLEDTFTFPQKSPQQTTRNSINNIYNQDQLPSNRIESSSFVKSEGYNPQPLKVETSSSSSSSNSSNSNSTSNQSELVQQQMNMIQFRRSCQSVSKGRRQNQQQDQSLVEAKQYQESPSSLAAVPSASPMKSMKFARTPPKQGGQRKQVVDLSNPNQFFFKQESFMETQEILKKKIELQKLNRPHRGIHFEEKKRLEEKRRLESLPKPYVMSPIEKLIKQIEGQQKQTVTPREPLLTTPPTANSLNEGCSNVISIASSAGGIKSSFPKKQKRILFCSPKISSPHREATRMYSEQEQIPARLEILKLRSTAGIEDCGGFGSQQASAGVSLSSANSLDEKDVTTSEKVVVVVQEEYSSWKKKKQLKNLNLEDEFLKKQIQYQEESLKGFIGSTRASSVAKTPRYSEQQYAFSDIAQSQSSKQKTASSFLVRLDGVSLNASQENNIDSDVKKSQESKRYYEKKEMRQIAQLEKQRRTNSLNDAQLKLSIGEQNLDCFSVRNSMLATRYLSNSNGKSSEGQQQQQQQLYARSSVSRDSVFSARSFQQQGESLYNYRQQGEIVSPFDPPCCA